MIEKVKNWWLASDLKIYPVDANYERESGKIVFFIDPETNESYCPAEGYKLYLTEEDAKKDQVSRLNYLEGINSKFRDLMEEIYFLNDDVCPFDRTDLKEIRNDSGWYRRYNKLNDRLNLLKIFITTGMLNINGISIRKEDVIRLKWYNKEHVFLTTTDGKEFMTRTEAEYEVVRLLFGKNESNRVFNAEFDKDGQIIK